MNKEEIVKRLWNANHADEIRSILSDYDKTNTPQIRNQRIVIIALVLIMTVSALIGMFVFRSMRGEPTPNYSQQLAIEKKQHGNEQAILLNEIETITRKFQKANNAKDSIRQREINLTATNLTLMKKLRQTLPKECDTVFVLCDEIINVKDSSYAALFDVFQLCVDNNEAKDSLIVSYQSENVIDSLQLAVSQNETKRERNGKRAAVGFGIGLLILWITTNVIN